MNPPERGNARPDSPESLDVTAPSLGLGAFPAGEQVGLDLIEPGQHPGFHVQDGHLKQANSCWQGVP